MSKFIANCALICIGFSLVSMFVFGKFYKVSDSNVKPFRLEPIVDVLTSEDDLYIGNQLFNLTNPDNEFLNSEVPAPFAWLNVVWVPLRNTIAMVANIGELIYRAVYIFVRWGLAPW